MQIKKTIFLRLFANKYVFLCSKTFFNLFFRANFTLHHMVLHRFISNSDNQAATDLTFKKLLTTILMLKFYPGGVWTGFNNFPLGFNLWQVDKFPE